MWKCQGNFRILICKKKDEKTSVKKGKIGGSSIKSDLVKIMNLIPFGKRTNLPSKKYCWLGSDFNHFFSKSTLVFSSPASFTVL